MIKDAKLIENNCLGYIYIHSVEIEANLHGRISRIAFEKKVRHRATIARVTVSGTYFLHLRLLGTYLHHYGHNYFKQWLSFSTYY